MPSKHSRQTSQVAPAILRLPLELRQQIYAHLLPRENVSHPLPSVGITSVSHRPPSRELLNIHPQLADEILEYFYTITTWKLIFSHAFNFFRVDPDLRRLEQSPSLARFRRVEVVVFCDVLLLKGYPLQGNGALESFCSEIRKRADRACDVLSHATKLNTVTVSWIDTTGTRGWDEKATILQPLRKLRRLQGRELQFRTGLVNGCDDVDRETFTQAMLGVLGESGDRVRDERCTKSPPREKNSDSSVDSGSTPSDLRLLAFDVRQERHLLHPPTSSQAVTGTVGWESRVAV